MKKLTFVVSALLWAASPTSAQPKAVHYKVLQEALPTTSLPGFTRGKATGSTQTMMGMSTSEASVRYEKSGGEDVSVSVKIADVMGVPMGGMALAIVPAVDQESETESGYTKTVTLRKKYRAMEEATTGGDSKSCKLTVPVANRFIVELEGNGVSDVKLLHALVENMAFEKLEAAAVAK